MKAKTVTGWMAKRAAEHGKLFDGFDDHLRIYRTKLREADWSPEDWPPVRVRVTLEEVRP